MVPNWSTRIIGCSEDAPTNGLGYPNAQSRYGANDNDSNQDLYPEFLLLAQVFEKTV